MSDKDCNNSSFDRMDERWSWAFPIWFFAFVGIFFLSFLLLCLGVDRLGRVFALGGAVLACCGVFTIARPMIRVGGYKAWVKMFEYRDPPAMIDGNELKERDSDAYAVQVFGPALVIFGTLMNGASAFF